KSTPNKTFTFGCSAAFWPRKNVGMLIDAFHKEFKNSKQRKLFLEKNNGKTIFLYSSKKSWKEYIDEFIIPILDENIMSSLYNNYFGSGLSSIVFPIVSIGG
ncbi:MAG: hypothetical protein RLZZ479_1159, partial [Bacteroidota bacterium]